jgi:hypothetical protein
VVGPRQPRLARGVELGAEGRLLIGAQPEGLEQQIARERAA